jgi:hypothetical protein
MEMMHFDVASYFGGDLEVENGDCLKELKGGYSQVNLAWLRELIFENLGRRTSAAFYP